MTREEKNAYMREWRKNNKEKKSEANKKYRLAHKEQIKEAHRKWREKNREHINSETRRKYKENPEVFKKRQDKYRITHQEEEKQRRHKYKIENRQKCANYERSKRHSDSLYRLRGNVRTLIRNSIKCKGYKKNTKTEQILGCSIDYFIEYIQSKFKEGMTLENHGEWHIDHIIPVSSATTEEELIKLNHYTNLQPLWAEENLKKGNKIISTQ